MLISLLLLLLACGEPDNNPNPADGGTDTGTEDGGTYDGGDDDGGTDTGTGDGGGGDCGGPDPPKDSLWTCENGTSDLEGPPWPIAGGPADTGGCLTTGGWAYNLTEDGKSVIISDGEEELSCEWDGEKRL